MTNEYITKLIDLARELRDYPGITTNSEEEARNHNAIFDAKLQYLLGYIMALEDAK